MNADQIFNVTKEFSALLNDFAVDHQKLLSDPQANGFDRDEIIRKHAMKAANIVSKHAKWPADLSERLGKIQAYSDAHPEQAAEAVENADV